MITWTTGSSSRNPKSNLHWLAIRNPVPGTLNPQCGMQNCPGLAHMGRLALLVFSSHIYKEKNKYNYYTLYSLSVFSLAMSLRLILEMSATYRLVDNWLICRLWAGGGGELATAFDLAAFRLSMIAPVKKSVNHPRTVASMRDGLGITKTSSSSQRFQSVKRIRFSSCWSLLSLL